MKQHITTEQFNELSDKGKQKLAEWLNKVSIYQTTLLSIGKMIEYLGEDWKYSVIESYPSSDRDNLELSSPSELCDDLWQGVKNRLEQK